jgi:hypothetical protein
VSQFIPGVRPPRGGERLIRVGRTVFELGEVEIRRFKELAAAEKDLQKLGIRHLHELASSDHQKLAASLGYRAEEVDALIRTAKQLLESMSRS